MHVTCKARDVCIVWDHPARTNRTSSPCSTQKIAHSAPGLLPPHSKKKKSTRNQNQNRNGKRKNLPRHTPTPHLGASPSKITSNWRRFGLPQPGPQPGPNYSPPLALLYRSSVLTN